MKPPYKISTKILALVASISEKIGEVNAAHLHKPPTELRKKNRVKTIQSSLEIEGNTLTVEKITAIIEHKRVAGPKKDILEVKNAIEVYNAMDTFNPYSLSSFCQAHSVLMKGLIESPGTLRNRAVGIIKGSAVTHIAPSQKMVKPLMNELFRYLKNDKELLLIKSCVFHYELEFIHPFIDGNGRMGRFWQTVILKDKYPVFEFLPIETIIKARQVAYYEALGKSDKTGQSTLFIEFMLGVIQDSLEELLKTQNVVLTGIERIQAYESCIKNESFSRKDYLRYFKEISAPTASRDLKQAVDEGLLVKSGEKNTSRYKFK